MNIRPCFFLKAEKNIESKCFQSLKGLGWPVMVSAFGAQKNLDWDRIVESVGQDGLHILSNDIDEDQHILHMAWEACLQKGWTHMVVLEDLNDPLLQKLPELMDSCLKNPWSFIVLNDVCEQESRKTNFIEKALLGGADYNHLKSPNCCYPIFFIKNLSLNRKSPFAHLKILVSLLWRGVEALSIPVPQQNVKKVKKTFREKLYQMYYDTLLVSVANIRQNDRPKNAAISCAVGAFIACTPFYGFQTLLIFLACFVFRLNFPIAFIGSQVSLPPIYSLILPLEIYVGFKLMNKPFIEDGDILQTAQNHFSSWLLGAVVVGGAIALAVGGLWYFLQRASQREKKDELVWKNVRW